MNTRVNISLLQLFMLYICTAYGAGVLAAPRTIGIIAREDMWLSMLIGGLAMSFSLWCAISLSKRFPYATAIEYHCVLLGPIIGNILNLYYLFNLVLLTTMALRLFSSALKLFLFDLTPPYVFTFVLLGVAAYAGQYGIAPLLRLQQFIAFFISPFFIVLTLLGFCGWNLAIFCRSWREGLHRCSRAQYQVGLPIPARN
jgi:amino acid transporter